MDNQKFKYFDMPGQHEYLDVVCFCLKDNRKKVINDILKLIEQEFQFK